jgi:PAS domain S-box-containing protein
MTAVELVASSNREKRRNVAMTRGLLLVAIGALLLESGVRDAAPAAVALLVAFFASNIALLFLPTRIVASQRFDPALALLDLGLVVLGIHLAGAGPTALPVSCLLMIVVVVLGSNGAHVAAGATAVGALHAWLVLSRASDASVGQGLALQILFLSAVALHYATLAEDTHLRRRRRLSDDDQRREISTLLQILDAITSSLDERRVAYTIVRRLADVVPSPRCSLLWIDPRENRCFVLASHDNPDLDMLEVDLRKYPEIRRAMETRNPVIIRDVFSDPLMAEVRDKLRHLDFLSMVIVPLTFGDDLLGTLCLRATRLDDRFSRREIDFIQAVARASSNALKNAMLHRQVRNQSDKLSCILEKSADLILTTDGEGRVTEFNRGAERVLGRRRDEVVGRPWRTLLPDRDDGTALEAALGSGRQTAVPTRLSGAGGRSVDLQIQLSPLESTEARSETVWIGRDTTELKRTQQQLLQAEKLSTIGQVISGVAHELNNPLSVVVGFSQLLMAKHGSGPHARDLERISDAALRSQKVVSNLLSFARATAPERRLLGVNGILEKTLDLRKYQLRAHGIEVVTEFDPLLPMTLLDFHQMQQVFLNLINNAEHAMTESGRKGLLRVRTCRSEGWVQVEIEDNGSGMTPEVMERIFDPFFTTKPQGVGTGLGLSVSYGIIKEHGGSISARSQKGVGTTFVIEIPVVTAESPAGDLPERPGGSVLTPSRTGTILVVDDEPMILDLLVEVLGKAGHRVDTAADGVEALRKLGKRPFDVVVTDVRMPGKNGMDLYREAVTARPDIDGRFVFVTGDLIDREVTEFLLGADVPTIGKPIDIGALQEIVARIIETAQAGSESGQGVPGQ